MGDFGVFSAPVQASFCSKDTYALEHKIFKKCGAKIFLKFFTLGTSNGLLKIAPNVKTSRFQKAEKVKNCSWPKKSIFSESEISLPQSNHGKRNIKLMLVRP